MTSDPQGGGNDVQRAGRLAARRDRELPVAGDTPGILIAGLAVVGVPVGIALGRFAATSTPVPNPRSPYPRSSWTR
jgi:hypothetical protein